MSAAKAPARAAAAGRYKPYPAYKDSGVEWLGEIPAGWTAKRLKYVAPARISKLDVKPDDAVYVGLEHVESWTGRLLLENQPETVDSVVGSFKAGDVLFGKLRPYLAKVARPDFDGVCTSEILPLRPVPECLQSYVMYELLNAPYIRWIDSLTYGTKMPRVSPDQVASSFVGLPPLPEQRAIAAFLDRETARIDALVAKKERLIELLQEQRTALITRAVTKGLDPNVHMKDSGVEWLGEMPAHWSVSPLGARYYVQLGKMLDSSKITGRYLRPYLRVFDVQWGIINTAELPEMDFDITARDRYRLEVGDLLVNEGGSYPGRSAVWQGDIDECYYQKALHRLRALQPRKDLAQYLFYSMYWAATQGVFIAGGNETTIEHLPAERLRRYRFAFPSHEEQREIAAFLDRETARIDALVVKVRDAIDRLKELRTALISAAVTGKIDVREEVA